MLSLFVGSVDVNAAGVLVALFAALCITITSIVVKAKSRLAVNHEFELAKLKQRDETAVRMTTLQLDREYKMKQLSQNLITSHREDKNDSG